MVLNNLVDWKSSFTESPAMARIDVDEEQANLLEDNLGATREEALKLQNDCFIELLKLHINLGSYKYNNIQGDFL